MYIIQKKADKTFLTTSYSWNKKLSYSKIFKRKCDLFEALKYMREWNKTLRKYRVIDIEKELNIFLVELGKLQKDIFKEFKAQQTLKELQKN